MITKTFISKFTTIIKDSLLNTGLNPIGELVYGKLYSRMLVYFNLDKIKDKISDKTFPDISKLKHTLHITNAGSIDFKELHIKDYSDINNSKRERASSFNLIFFLIPKEWDSGKGYDYSVNQYNIDFYGKNSNGRFLSTDGANWQYAQNGLKWDEDGIFSNETLSNEYEKFSNNEKSLIIGRQHFDIGNEDINIDITNVVNEMINGNIENYGIGIAFSPALERSEDDTEKYIGFLTNKTNTFFEPYLETQYTDYISDDRSNFYLDKDNKLYLYCNIGGELTNLDELPKCHINNKEYEVFQYSKGIYYINIKILRNECKKNVMLYDIWSNLKYNGVDLDPVELDFVTKDNLIFFNIGNKIIETNKLYPTIYGINYDEKIQRGDIRKLIINSRIRYKNNVYELTDNVFVRLYVKDGTREIDVLKFEKANKTYLENYIFIDTNILLPQKYYIDIKYYYNGELIIHHNVLSFQITDNLNNKYL